MALTENLPFPRGSTFFGPGGTPNATDGAYLEGREYEVPDVHPITGVRRSNKIVRLRIVRNGSTVALLPKHLVTYDTTAGKWGTHVIGYNRLEAAATAFGTKGHPLDEYLPATGLPVNDLGYIVVRGPAIAITSTAGSTAENTISVGGVLIGATAANSTAATTNGTTAADGKIRGITVNQTYSSLDIFNAVGIALSAKTSSNTAAEILVEVGRI